MIRPSESLEAGQSATLSIEVTGLAASGVVQWSTTKGTFTAPTSAASTAFVAPMEPGPLVITCSITSHGKTTVRTLAVDVKSASAGQAGRSVATAAERAGTSPPPGSSAAGDGSLPRPYDVERGAFVPSGWMGDGERGRSHVQVNRQAGQPQQWTYKPGPAGWAAVAWQYPENNWGDRKGRDLSAGGFQRVTVRAKGGADAQGRFPTVQFKAGGHTSPAKRYQASFQVDGEVVTLTAEWKEYRLDLRGQDLSNVACAFVWVLRAADNPGGASFHIESIRYE